MILFLPFHNHPCEVINFTCVALQMRLSCLALWSNCILGGEGFAVEL